METPCECMVSAVTRSMRRLARMSWVEESPRALFAMSATKIVSPTGTHREERKDFMW